MRPNESKKLLQIGSYILGIPTLRLHSRGVAVGVARRSGNPQIKIKMVARNTSVAASCAAAADLIAKMPSMQQGINTK